MTAPKSGGELFADFAANYRKVIFLVIALLCAALAAFFAVNAVSTAREKKAALTLESLLERYDGFLLSIDEGKDAAIEVREDGTVVSFDSFLAELQKFSETAQGYAGAKAASMLGNVYAKQKNWLPAMEAYVSASTKGAKTHLYGVSLFNAAVCAAEGGSLDEAVSLYEKSILAPFPLYAAHAQFAIGVLQEKKGDTEAARAAYRKTVEGYASSDDSKWANLAQSRLIALE